MNVIRCVSLIASAVVALVGCQTHLPKLETDPKVAAPKTPDILHHIECELADIVNYTNPVSTANQPGSRLYNRINDKHSGLSPSLLAYLKTYHFVATAQLSLEVTDNEALTPSLSYTNASGQGVFSLGGQLTGTQDRSVTVNYAIDLKELAVDDKVDFRQKFCPASRYGFGTRTAIQWGLTGGIAGDLGLADIVADGLTALDVSAGNNQYTSSGPVPPAIGRRVSLTGTVTLPKITRPKTEGPTTLDVNTLEGTLLIAPQAAGNLTQGTASLSGRLTLAPHGGGTASTFLVNWTGTVLPPQKNDAVFYYTLTGNLVPLSAQASQLVTQWGYNPTVTLSGSINQSIAVSSELAISGVVTAVAGTDYDKQSILVSLSPSNNTLEAAGSSPAAGAAPQAAKGGGAAGSSAGGTSFGSLVDFTIVYGLNGGPAWTFKRSKEPSGASTPFLSATRTKTDSLAISFVAACQDYSGVKPQVKSYWGSIAACDDINAAFQQGASVGYENNSLMLLRNFLVHP